MSRGIVARSEIRALSIAQPWAELILRERKPFELRTWKTNYRGPLLIHASRKINRAAMRELRLEGECFPAGAFVGIAVLKDVRPYTRADARLLKRKRGFSWVTDGEELLRSSKPRYFDGTRLPRTVPLSGLMSGALQRAR